MGGCLGDGAGRRVLLASDFSLLQTIDSRGRISEMNGTSGPTSPRVGNLIEAGANPPITAEMIGNADRNDE